jgi:Tol biopolymer transport system component/DNA-binding winged helix-turn-helix (wHTH) protein
LVSRFGVFTLDHSTGELFKHGVRVRLGGQPFQILCLLIERQGEVVTRDEIRARIWPGTFVDFDGALNTAIRRIRSALGDTAENPRFVETVPKVGYRFLVPLETSRPGPVTVVVPAAPKRSLQHAVVAAVLLVATATILLAAVLLNRPAPRVARYSQITRDGQPKYGPLATDGVWLYYNVVTDSGSAIGQVPVTGEHQAATIWPGYWMMDLSRSGAELLAHYEEGSHPAEGDGPLWILPLPTGSPRKLDIAGHGRWSPDGSMLAYSNGSTIYLAGHDGSNPRRLSKVDGALYELVWSLDGRNLRLNLMAADGSGIAPWEIASDGSGLRRISGSGSWAGVWSPDARYFVFGRGGDLWTGRDGRQPSPLTAGPISFQSPVFSRDGKSLFAVGEVPRGQVVRYDPASGQYLPYLRGISADGLAFSRDGQWVAYTSFPDHALWRSRTDGSERLQLTFGSPGAAYPRWSADGSQIAFTESTSPKGHEHFQIYLVAAGGGAPQPLAPSDADQAIPAWSPDGKLLAFGGAPWMKNWAPDSTAIRLYDFAARSTTKLAGSDGLWAPKWSPDGRYIAAKRADSRELMLWDRSTNGWAELAREKDMIQYTAWSHDNKCVYFNLSNPPDIFRVCLDNPKVEEVLLLKDFRVAFTGAYWFGLTPDDSLVLLRDTGVQEIYKLDLR